MPRARSSGLPLVRMRLAAIATVISLAAAPAVAQVVNGRAGWEAIREGRTEDAATAFAEALRLQPRDPSLYLGAALAAQLLGDTAHARESVDPVTLAAARERLHPWSLSGASRTALKQQPGLLEELRAGLAPA